MVCPLDITSFIRPLDMPAFGVPLVILCGMPHLWEPLCMPPWYAHLLMSTWYTPWYAPHGMPYWYTHLLCPLFTLLRMPPSYAEFRMHPLGHHPWYASLGGFPFGKASWDGHLEIPHLVCPFQCPPRYSPFGSPLGDPLVGSSLGDTIGGPRCETPLAGLPLGTPHEVPHLGDACFGTPVGGTDLLNSSCGTHFRRPLWDPLGEPLGGLPLVDDWGTPF